MFNVQWIELANCFPLAKVGIKKHPQRVATYRATLRMYKLYICVSEYLAP